MMDWHRRERGFTIVELLVVIVILGVLASVATVAVTRFVDKGNANAANTELHQARTAIQACISDSERDSLDSSVPVEWDGSPGVVTATSASGIVYDASDYLCSRNLKAIYTVAPSGEITMARANGWTRVSWEDGYWKNGN